MANVWQMELISIKRGTSLRFQPRFFRALHHADRVKHQCRRDKRKRDDAVLREHFVKH